MEDRVAFSRPANIGPLWKCLLLGLSMQLPLAFASTTQTQVRQVPVDSLIFDLKNPDPVRRKEAALNLGNRRIQRATPDLVEAARDADPSVRREVVIALDKMRDIRALQAFADLCGDREKEIRQVCITGLVNLYLPQESGLTVTLNKVANFFNPWSDEWAEITTDAGIQVDARATVALRSRLQDSEENIRARAARALGILQGKDAVPALVDSMRNDRSNNVRFESVRALRKIGDTSVAGDVMNFLNYNDAKLRNEAVSAIGRFRHRPAVPELARLYERESTSVGKKADRAYLEHLLNALAFIADPASRDLFLKESKSPDAEIRLHSFEGIARIGDPSSVTEISRDFLQEKDGRVKCAQAYALYRMGRKEYLDEVVRGLASRRTNSVARQLLVEIRSEELPELHAQAKSNDTDIREGLAEVLGLVGDNSSIPTLQELGKDTRGQISALANQAIRRINAKNKVH